MASTLVHPATDSAQIAALMQGAHSTVRADLSGYLRQAMPGQFTAGPGAAPASNPAPAPAQGWAAAAHDAGSQLAEAVHATGAMLERALDGLLRTLFLQGAAAQAAPLRTTVPTVPTDAADDVGRDGEGAALAGTLRNWVDYEKAREHADSPYRLLQAVFHHHRQPLPNTFLAGFDVAQLEDEGLLDEAAVLYHQLRHDADDSGELPPLERLRTRFLAALRADCDRRQALAHRLAAPANASQQQPHFDGFVLRHAFGKSFDVLLGSPGLSRDPALATLDTARKRELLQAKFVELGESPQYLIGSPQHSLASVLIRIAQFMGRSVPARFENDEALLATLQRVEQAWSRNRASFPLHPRLFFAMHLARTSGVELLDTAGLQARYEQVMELARAQRNRTGDWDAQLWLQGIPAKWNRDGRQWMQQQDSVKREALLASFEALRGMSLRETSPAGVAAQRIWEFAAQVKQAGFLGEALVGDCPREKAAAVLAYGQERLQAALGPAPSFSRAGAARAILRQHGMDEATIDRPRHYRITAELTTQRHGNRVEEFLDRAEAPLLAGAYMRVGTQDIHAASALQQAEEAYNAGLASDPQLRRIAKEHLRMRQDFTRDGDVEKEVQRMVPSYRARTEQERQELRMLREGINMIPFVGSGLNIYEGIRDKDIEQTLLGIGSLGMDIGGAAAGGARPKKVPARQRQALSDFRHVTGKLDIPTARAGDRYADDAVWPHDVPQLAKQDGNVPPEHRPLAARVRNGESGVRWNGFELVYLPDEDRVVPVRTEGGATFREIDWNKGTPVYGQAIERDADGKFRAAHGLKGGSGRASRRGEPVLQRLTPATVLTALEQVNDASLRDFHGVFDRCFKVMDAGNALLAWESADGSGIRGVKSFFERLYRQSHTFRRVLNHYDATAPHPKQWSLNFGGRIGNLHPASASVHPLSRNIDYPIDLARGTFMSAAGLSTYSKENVALHELLHALTGLDDPAPHDRRLNARAEPKFDRGAIVYLTDKILNDAGFDFDERVTYYDMKDGAGDSRLPQAVSDAHAENRYLDKLMDRYRPPMPGDSLVAGQPVAERVTVRQWQQVAAALAGKHRRAGWSRLQERFAFGAGDDSATATLKQVGQRLLKSKIFRALLDDMPARQAGPWRFEFDKAAALSELPSDRASSGAVSRLHGEVYLFDDQTSYLSETGLRAMEYERRVVQGFVHAMTDLPLSGEALYKHRGAAVLLTDRILQEAGYHFPEQVLAARAMPGPEAHKRLLAHLTSARRAAAAEDAYLGRLN